PPQTPGNIALEVIWTVLPIVTVIALFVLTMRTSSAVDTAPTAPTVAVEVTAFTWQWSFHYPDGDVTITGTPGSPPELAVPVGASLAEWLTTTDHKRIGILYMSAAFGFFLAGGLMALVLRAELTAPGLQVVSEATYNELFTLHGTIMLLLFGTPMALGLANY